MAQNLPKARGPIKSIEVRSTVLRVVVSTRESNRIREGATIQGVSLSAFVRQAALRVADGLRAGARRDD